MKYLLIILFLFGSAQAQYVQDSSKYIRYQNQYGMRMPRIWADSAFNIPVIDTTYRPQKAGAFVMHPVSFIIYYWNGSLWQPVGSGIQTAPGTGDSALFSNGRYMRLFAAEYGVDITQYTNELGVKADTVTSNSLVTKHMLSLVEQQVVGNFETASIYEGLPGDNNRLLFWRNDSTLIMRTPLAGYGLIGEDLSDTTSRYKVDTSTGGLATKWYVDNISFAGTNFANTDLTFDDSHVHDLAGNTLIINSGATSLFTMSPDPGTGGVVDFHSQSLVDPSIGGRFYVLTTPDSTELGYSALYGVVFALQRFIASNDGPKEIHYFEGGLPGFYYRNWDDPDSNRYAFPIVATTNTGDFSLAHDTVTGQIVRIPNSGGDGGGGSVTAVSAGYGTSFTTFTTTGSVIIDTAAIGTRPRIQKGIDSVLSVSIGSLSAIGATPNSNGASITGRVLNLQPASASFGGVVTTTTQTFAGNKTFNNDITVNGHIVGEGGGSTLTNLAVGVAALSANTTAGGNTGLGYNALQELTGSTNSHNTGVGFSSGKKIQGLRNTGAGSLSLSGSATSSSASSDNTAYGYQSLTLLQTGDKNIFYGTNSGDAVTTSSFNLGIGYNAMNTSNADSSLIIGNGAGPALSGSKQFRMGHVRAGKPEMFSGDMGQDTLRLNTSLKVRDRFNTTQGTAVAAANNLTLGLGNVFSITGATTINAITTASWYAGAEIILIFASTPTVKNNTAGGAGTAVMLLAGGADFSATSNDVLRLVYNGTSWYEVSRSIN